MSRVIIAGSRDVVDRNFIEYNLGWLMQVITIDTVLSGLARGPDLIGRDWANKHGIVVEEYPAAWNVDGVFDRSAGYKRNTLMAQNADVLVAFWDGTSVGTKHMIDEALRHGLDLFVIQTRPMPVEEC